MQPEPESENTCKCWENHHCRKGYFYTDQAIDTCCIECDRPGIGSKDFQGGNCKCTICCIPFTLIIDIICCIPITFGYLVVENPN